MVNPSISVTNNRFSSGQDYSYDNAGNTTADAQGRTFIYDAENKQIEVKNSLSQTIGEYFYDGDGKRVKKITGSEVTIFVYDAQGKLVAEYANQITNNPEVSYLTSDHLGSLRINTDKNGNVTARHDYQPFGEEIQRTVYDSDEVRKKFTSYERDNETDLDFAEARYYSKNHGRFTTIDPELQSMKAVIPQSWNRYTYVLNNPILFIDPNGEVWMKNTDGNARNNNQYVWYDTCPEGGTCYEAIAHSDNVSVTVFGSNGAADITNYQANKDGVIDIRALSQHHNAEFIVADNQKVPEEFLKPGSATALFNVAKYYSEFYKDDDKLVFTAGGASNGKTGICDGAPCHSGHAGIDIDLRYMNSSGKPITGDDAYSSADVGRTNFLVAVFKDNGHPYSYTGDDSRFGRSDDTPKNRDKTEKVHRHHLHVGLTPPKSKRK